MALKITLKTSEKEKKKKQKHNSNAEFCENNLKDMDMGITDTIFSVSLSVIWAYQSWIRDKISVMNRKFQYDFLSQSFSLWLQFSVLFSVS